MGYCIVYDSIDGHYIVHTKDGEVQFNKNEMCVLYIDANKNRMWPLYKQSGRALKVSPREKSPRLNYLAKLR